MPVFNRFLAATSTCTLVPSAIAFNVSAQQTTPDVRLEDAVNTPERPYRPAGSSDLALDGQYALLSSAEVVDVKTKNIVTQMKDEYGKPMHSEKFREMSFSNGKLVRTVSQFGQGLLTAVQARRAGRTPAAN